MHTLIFPSFIRGFFESFKMLFVTDTAYILERPEHLFVLVSLLEKKLSDLELEIPNRPLYGVKQGIRRIKGTRDLIIEKEAACELSLRGMKFRRTITISSYLGMSKIAGDPLCTDRNLTDYISLIYSLPVEDVSVVPTESYVFIENTKDLGMYRSIIVQDNQDRIKLTTSIAMIAIKSITMI